MSAAVVQRGKRFRQVVDQSPHGRGQAATGGENEMDDAVLAPSVDEDAHEPASRQVRGTGMIRQKRDAQPVRSRVAQNGVVGAGHARFVAQHVRGTTATLRTLLAEDAVLRSDGGGKVLAFINPIMGLDRLLRLYEAVRRKRGEGWAQMLEPVWIDGLPGYVSRERGDVLQTTALAIEGGRISAIFITRNPDKLRHVAQALAAVPDPDSQPR